MLVHFVLFLAVALLGSSKQLLLVVIEMRWHLHYLRRLLAA